MAKNKGGVGAQDAQAGGPGDDVLIGTANGDHLAGWGGNDILRGLAHNDALNGGDGNDLLDGGVGVDKMIGEAGNDTYIVDNANDWAVEVAGGGHDKVLSSVNHTLDVNVEDLELTGTANLNGIGNGIRNDMWGNSGNNRLEGLDGDDYLYGNGGRDVLIGGNGADVLTGGAGEDRMTGGGGDDVFVVDNANDTTTESSNGGIDRVITTLNRWTLGSNIEDLYITGTNVVGRGNGLANYIYGDSASGGELSGLGGNDRIEGLNNETLLGGDGNDWMRGNGGNRMEGGAGRDILTMSHSGDLAFGGGGIDRFDVDADGVVDCGEIRDFDARDEQIFFSGAFFETALGEGPLAANRFHSGSGANAVAQNVNHRFIFNTSTGVLYYDPDGNGAAAQVQVLEIDVSAGTFSVNDIVIGSPT